LVVFATLCTALDDITMVPLATVKDTHFALRIVARRTGNILKSLLSLSIYAFITFEIFRNYKLAAKINS